MKVSIIIPVYNVEKYIERCLHSVFAQSYHNLECILVNDSTPDKSFLIAKELIEDFYEIIIPYWDYQYKHCDAWEIRKDIILNLE